MYEENSNNDAIMESPSQEELKKQQNNCPCTNTFNVSNYDNTNETEEETLDEEQHDSNQSPTIRKYTTTYRKSRKLY